MSRFYGSKPKGKTGWKKGCKTAKGVFMMIGKHAAAFLTKPIQDFFDKAIKKEGGLID